MNKTYLIAYDIQDDKRRKQIADFLLSFGHRIQFSVFLIESREAAFIRMHDKLQDLIAAKDDSVLICHLGATSVSGKHLETIGRNKLPDYTQDSVF